MCRLSSGELCHPKPTRRCILTGSALVFLTLASGHRSRAWGQSVYRLAVTTSFENSGLADVLGPQIERDLGIDLQLIVAGTGQALRLASAGDVDAVLVHSREDEEQFVAQGHGTHRREIMYNDFLIVGPDRDLAGLKRANSATDAMKAIYGAAAPFVSRGDDSGTHKRELQLWQRAGLRPIRFSTRWYRETGSGMGATLRVASNLDAHTLTDRGSWMTFGGKGSLAALFEGDSALHNTYAFLPVDADRHPHVKADISRHVEAWLAGPVGQAAIASLRVSGRQLFVPSAH